jgi:hypothetical protein
MTEWWAAWFLTGVVFCAFGGFALGISSDTRISVWKIIGVGLMLWFGGFSTAMAIAPIVVRIIS